ncbi:MAG TPA: molecular chaperone DnaK [Rhodospirillaceae bacterium]|nr:molecular chaperone DnaK [Rhodospirillaceae bacterium]HAA94046.1 molecular chaperone DnaK [Rhodospirillaceae bacterium]HAT36125.1 molecular chaperone DnaK [Rhodospirillaceae bacterium]
MSSGDDLDFGHFRAALERERAEILNLSDQSEDERKPVELDQQSVGRLSRMDALQVQAMAKALDSRRQGRLMQIEAALQRIESGDYGICEGCDDEIPPKRLEIDPAARRCVNCAGV